jgi:predicted RND superfamily exporter protein
MSPEAQAFVIFSLGMLVLMGIGMNMALALVLTGAGMAWVLDFWDTQLLAQNLVAGVDSFPLLAVPFFILAGASSTWRRPGSATSVAGWASWPSARRC